MLNRKIILLFAAFVLVSVLLGCDHPAGTVVYVRTPPPPPIADAVIVSPGPDFIWIRGYQAWNGVRYIWVPGHWERRPIGRRGWVPGHWAHNGQGWFWIEGHWR